jgi:uncharacterized protein YpmB
MKSKQIIVSLIVLCLLGAYYFFFEVKKKQDDEAAAKQKATLFFGMDRDKLVDASIFGKSGKIELKNENGSWFIDKPFRAPADKNIVEEFFGQFLGAVYMDKFDNAVFSQYGLVTPAAGVTLTDLAGKKYEMNFGMDTAAGGNVYCSMPGNTSTVYMVSGILKGEADKKIFDWRDKRVAGNLDEAAITKISINVKGKKYTLVRQGGNWDITEPFTGKARKDKVNMLIDNFRSSQATNIEDATKASLSMRKLNSPSEYAAFSGVSGTSEVYFGVLDAKKNTVFCRGSYQNGIFEVPDYTYKNIQKAEDLVDKRIAGIEESAILRLNIKYAGREIVAVKTVKNKATPVWEVKSVKKISDKEKSLISPSSVSYALANLEYKEKIPTGKTQQDYGFYSGCEISAYGKDDLLLITIDTGRKLPDKNEIYVKNISSGEVYTVDGSFISSLNLPGLEEK